MPSLGFMLVGGGGAKDLCSQICGGVGVLLVVFLLGGGRESTAALNVSLNKAASGARQLLQPPDLLRLAGRPWRRGATAQRWLVAEWLGAAKLLLGAVNNAGRLRHPPLLDAPSVGAGSSWSSACSLGYLLDFIHQQSGNIRESSPRSAGRGGEGERRRRPGMVASAGVGDGLEFPGSDSASSLANPKRNPCWAPAIHGQGDGHARLDGRSGQSIFNLHEGRPLFSLCPTFPAAAGPSGDVPGFCNGGRGRRRACSGDIGLDRVCAVLFRVFCVKVLYLVVFSLSFRVLFCKMYTHRDECRI